jgi:serpin B
MAASDSPQRHHLRFCLTLHRAVAPAGRDSCFSPYSVASALGLVSRAAQGKAADELIALLCGSGGDSEEQADLLRHASGLAGRASGEAPVLAVSNTLWAWEKLPLNEGFLDELARWPGGRVAKAPFVSDPEAARREINADVAQTTRGLIPELLPPGSISPDTVATLVNALYLRVAWSHPFQESATGPEDFHGPRGTKQVPMMKESESLGYATGEGWQVVTLPAVGGVEAVVLLPDGDLAEREATLDEVVLDRLLGATTRRTVHLSMPKIQLNVRSPLTDALRSLGAGTMFTDAADFSPLTEDPRLVIDDVFHQAVLRVDERGLEGAAATAVTMRLTSIMVEEPVVVEVDRPFLLLVRHAETGVVYFFTRVVDP